MGSSKSKPQPTTTPPNNDVATLFEKIKIYDPTYDWRIYSKSPSVSHPDESKRHVEKAEIPKENLRLFGLYNSLDYDSKVVRYIELMPYDRDYQIITRMITNKRNFKVDSIEKIINPFLEKAYKLRKEKKQTEFPYFIEQLLFHGTKQQNVDQICKNNFNWRACQTHKYGRGVSFSPNSTYASVYSDVNVYNKVMLVAKVMIGESCVGNEFMDIPPEGYDTARKDDGIVIVKFDDHEFYPAYKINYHVLDESVGRASNNGHRRRRR